MHEAIRLGVEKSQQEIGRHTKVLHAAYDGAYILDAIERCPSSQTALAGAPVYRDTYYGDCNAEVVVTLNPQPTVFVRELVTQLGVPGQKEKEWDGSALQVELNYQRIKIRIHAYIPPTCEVVYEDVVIPAQPEKTVKKARIVCDKSELPEPVSLLREEKP